MLAVTFTNQIGLGTAILAALVLAYPTSVLAWHSIKRQRLLDADAHKREEDQRLTRAVATELGIELKETPGTVAPEKRGPAVVTVLEATAHQLTPSNGKTVAKIVEETHSDLQDMRRELAAVAVALGEHTRDGHGS